MVSASMMKTALISAVVLWAATGVAAPVKPSATSPAKTAATKPAATKPAATKPAATKPATNIFESPEAPRPEGSIDEIVFAKLATLGAKPVLCSDAVFVRRAYLDVIGTLPTAKEARAFIQDPDTKNKRGKLIDQLLERDEFADYWSMRWGDILRIKAEFPVNLWPNAAQAYHRWVRSSLAENKRYDQFVRELLTSSGSNFRVGPVNFYRAIQNRTPEGIAAAVALAFLGSRSEAWPKERAAGLTVFFSEVGYKPTNEWKEEIVFWDPLKASAVPGNAAPGRAAIVPPPAGPSTNTNTVVVLTLPTNSPPQSAMLPDGSRVQLSPDTDPREVFANWLISPNNRAFNRAIVNRIWYWLLGRGIVHEPDDMRMDNPPSNPALLSFLEGELVSGRYDLKRIYRLILNSKTYQLSSVPHIKGPQAEANFAYYAMRRLDAEVLIDAINKVTGATDLYTSAIPEPFTYIPEDKPAIALPDGSIISPFLALFGRSARATGLENERINKPVPAQWLHLLNSSHIQKKLEQGPTLKALLDSGRKPEAIAEDLYLSILSRFPTAAELENFEELGLLGPAAAKPVKGSDAKRRENWIDVTWALINSTEFLYRH